MCPNSTATAWLGGSLSAICGTALITCQSSGSGSAGLDLIRGYSASGTGSASAAIVRDVTLTRGACTDDSAPYFLLNGGCRIGAQAQVDFGTTGDPSRAANQGGLNASVSVGNCNLSYTGSTGTTSNWAASNCQSLASGAGQVPLTLNWQTGSGNNRQNGSVAAAARPYSNDGVTGSFFTSTGSYPIAYAALSQGQTCTGAGANSVAFGSPFICVGVGLIGNLKDASTLYDPTKVLKFFQTSSTGAVDCGNGNLEQQIEQGCAANVQLNTGENCPNSTTPVDCLPTFQGQATGQVKHGMDQRFGCTVNNWIPANVVPPSTLPTIPDGDPRLVVVLITLYGEFTVSGRHSVPLTDYAAFYVTGWSGSSCSYNEAAPAGADSQSSIWGHFVKYVGTFSSSTGGAACDFFASSLTPCITVMTS